MLVSILPCGDIITYCIYNLDTTDQNTLIPNLNFSISILIGEEPEPGMRDLDKVEIPPEMRQELDRLRETEVVGGVSGESAQTDHS